jgi:hypothetical protein
MSEIAGPASAASCQDCITANYCQVAQMCAVSPDCQAHTFCRLNCVTGDCVGACALADGIGTTIYSKFTTPLIQQCQQSCEIGANWTCVGRVAWPPAKALTRALTVHLDPEDAGLTVKLCDGLDVNCANPVGDQIGTTDATGSVTLIDSSPTTSNGQNYGLDGYLDLAPPATSPQEILPTLVYWNFPLSEPDADLVTKIPVFMPGELDAISNAAGVTRDPSLGIIGLVALDCLGVMAPGVTFALTSGGGADTKIVYILTQGADQLGPTDDNGAALFVNVPAGPVTVTATPIALGRVSSRASVFVRAGEITEVNMSPTP